MKKAELLHTTILILAILTGYTAMQSAVSFLTYIAYSTYDPLRMSFFLYQLIPPILFSVACVLLIRNGRKYTAALLRMAQREDIEEEEGDAKAAPPDEATGDNPIEWQLDRRNIVFVLFVGMGLYTLIQSSPYVIVDVFGLFRDKVGADALRQGSPGRASLIIELLRVTIGAFLVYAAPALTNFIDKTIAVRLDSTSQTR